MTRVLLAALLLAAPLGAQTARDTAHVRVADSSIAVKLHLEANRKNGPRKTQINALADTLALQGRLLLGPPPAPANKPPVALFTAPSNCKAGAICTFTSVSTDDKAVVSQQWDCDAIPNCNSTGLTASIVYPHGGPRNVSLTVRDAEGLSSTSVRTISVASDSIIVVPPDTTPVPPQPIDTGSIATRPELPRSVPNPTFAKATRTVTVTAPGFIRRALAVITFGLVDAGGDLQAALDASQPGDSLVLSGTFTGNYVLPTRQCGAGITITSATQLPAAGTRVTPTTAIGFAKLVSPNNAPALKTTNPTCGWRLVGLEITGTLPVTSIQYRLLWLGDNGYLGGGETQTDSSKVPRDFVLDRLYVHGSPTLNSMGCVSLNSATTVIRDSWISECHALGFDSQAIVGFNGPGPYLIENNYLEGAGENVMFGGADPGVPGMVPSDITIRRNHITKPLGWRGSQWSIKNLLELKSAQRVDISSNVIENSWPAAQEGAAVWLKSNANGCQCAFEGTRDVTLRYNTIRNAPIGVAISAADDSYGWTGFVHTQRVRLEQNAITEIGAEGRAALLLLTQDLADIAFVRNTITHATGAKGLVASMAYAGGAARRMEWTGNQMTATAGYALFYDGGIVHSAALTAMVGDKSWRFAGNTVVGMLPEYIPLNPPGNAYVSSLMAGAGADLAEIARRTAGVVVTP